MLLDWHDGLWNWLQGLEDRLIDWLSQPHIYAIIIVWAITFTVVCTAILFLGFGSAGVGAGTVAAAFQSWAYGGFTPAAGIFATLTSMAMLGTLEPAAAIFSAFIATAVAVVAWVNKVGR
ncbi:hypothetical protein EDB81DRAFT_886792 [Dactylonectria macrodidyma]|uniref:Uncharacterized protein n=1 Tax=Dactylonectria macrodidyma TaxID=307937 RepID=A0A9P9IUI9_9HYPO|nr:hypothetical protein EDB81DRAFT_886792 [Dactylonectria macrodidyma]